MQNNLFPFFYLFHLLSDGGERFGSGKKRYINKSQMNDRIYCIGSDDSLFCIINTIWALHKSEERRNEYKQFSSSHPKSKKIPTKMESSHFVLMT